MLKSKKTIKICSIFGSPKEQSRSTELHNAFLSQFEKNGFSVSRYFIHQLTVHSCTGCLSCRNTGRCIYNDDAVLVLQEAEKSSIITLSFPLYFTSLPGPLKSLIDRLQCFWSLNTSAESVQDNNIRGICFITAGSDYENMFNPSITILKHACKTLGGSLDIPNSVFCSGLDSPDADIIFKNSIEKADENAESLIKILRA